MDIQEQNQAAAEKAVADNATKLALNNGSSNQAISAGATPVIQTTTSARNQTQANMQNFDASQANRSNAAATKGGALNANGDVVDDSGNVIKTGDGGDTVEDGKQPSPDDEDSDEFSSSLKGSLDNIKSWGASQIASANATLKNALGYADQDTASTIAQLTDMYDDRITAVEDSYNRLGKQKQTDSLRSGLARYAPDQAAGILTNNEVQGHIAVNNLLMKLQDANQKATQAKQDNNTKAFNAAYTDIQNTNKLMGDQVTALYKEANTYKNNQMKADQANAKAAQDNISKGISTSKAAADFILNDADYKGMSTDDKSAFIKSYASKIGVDSLFLNEAVSAAAAKPASKSSSAPVDLSQYEEGDYIPGHGFLSPDGTITPVKYTATQDRALQDANIIGQDAATYFINTPADFQKQYIISLSDNPDTKSDLDAIHTAYTAYVADQAKSKAAPVSNPFAQ